MSSLQPSTQVWFEDGTIILQAENTLFRVYKGILAMNSHVFRDLFSYSGVEDEEPTYDGCPILRVYDDPKELPYFLKALHSVRYSKYLCRSFESTIALLRLGTKYEVPHLRAKAIQTLSLGFPTSLAAFDKGLPEEPFQFKVEHAFAVVNVARQLDVPQLLPSALYMVSMTSIPRILFGHDPESVYALANQSDKILCLSAREQIFASRAKYATFLHAPTRTRCIQPLVCEKERHRMHTQVLSESRDPLDFCFRWESDVADTHLCLQCVDGMKPRPEDCRQAFWNDLPAYFDLPGWDQYDTDDADWTCDSDCSD